MSSNLRKWFIIASIVLSVIAGILIIKEYMLNHTYYYNMRADTSNLYIILANAICAFIPVWYMIWFKKRTPIWWIVSLLISVILYWLIYASIRDNILGTGMIMRPINMIIVFFLWVTTIWFCQVIWNWLYKRFLKLETTSTTDILLSFGLWFAGFLVANYILILLNIYHPILVLVIFALMVYIVWRKRWFLKDIWSKLLSHLNYLTISKWSLHEIIGCALLLFTIMYINYGFFMAFIPYPTARDANHAYMAIPNFFSSFGGFPWSSEFGIWYTPLYLSFITFFFSLIKGIGSWFWIAPDTIWVEMNYLTAIFTLIATLGLINYTLSHFSFAGETSKKYDFAFMIWWFLKLLWLTSGMGAFLVIVDNKSDFWVMFLATMWLFAGIVAFKNFLQNKTIWEEDDLGHTTNWISSYIPYIILSGIFFAVAMASKPTATFDTLNYLLLVLWFVLGPVLLIWFSLLVMWVLTKLGMNGVDNFISEWFAKYVWFGGWWLLTLLGLWLSREKLAKTIKFVVVWWVTIIITLLAIKWPIAIYRLIDGQTNIKKIPQEILLVKNYKDIQFENDKNTWRWSDKFILLASNNLVWVLGNDLWTTIVTSTWSENESETSISDGDIVDTTTIDTTNNVAPTNDLTPATCTLQAVWLTSTSQLYDNLQEPLGDWYAEDVWRYVWYGQKSFANPWWWFVVPSNKCITVNKSAKIICENQTTITTLLDKAGFQSFLSKFESWSEGYTLISDIVNNFDQERVSDYQKSITDFWTDKVIYKNGTEVLIPYKTVVPLNVTFNRSLQNLSSYYTDIGIIWLVLQIMLILWLIYGIWSRNRLLWAVNLTAIIWRLLWIAIWWGIVWYGIWLITWTILAFVLYINALKSDEESDYNIYQIFVGIIVILGMFQLVLNFVRISSQWWAGPFVQYKFANGQIIDVNSNLQQTAKSKFPYRWDDVYNLQFPHYTKIIQEINSTKELDKVDLIAGTYAQYWVEDQTQIFADGLLSQLWVKLSDRDVCKSYLRLKDEKFRYLVIDPNIISIVMWWWNSSLIDRFFAKIDPITGKVIEDGTMSMIGKLVNQWYVSMYYSNNLWAKYAYEMDSDTIKQMFGITNDDDVAIARARLATARYRGNAQQLIELVGQIFTSRIPNGQAIWDIADIYGKVIDEDKLIAAVSKISSQWYDSAKSEIEWYTQDERFVLLNYLSMLSEYNKNPTWFTQSANNIASNSIWWWSQLMVFELK